MTIYFNKKLNITFDKITVSSYAIELYDKSRCITDVFFSKNYANSLIQLYLLIYGPNELLDRSRTFTELLFNTGSTLFANVHFKKFQCK